MEATTQLTLTEPLTTEITEITWPTLTRPLREGETPG